MMSLGPKQKWEVSILSLERLLLVSPVRCHICCDTEPQGLWDSSSHMSRAIKKFSQIKGALRVWPALCSGRQALGKSDNGNITSTPHQEEKDPLCQDITGM